MDRNRGGDRVAVRVKWSLSARRAWIEMMIDFSVSIVSPVALRKESVDRNCADSFFSFLVHVALRKESVDRNVGVGVSVCYLIPSLSARRAWIEIIGETVQRKESCRSLSARRAWIEIALFWLI